MIYKKTTHFRIKVIFKLPQGEVNQTYLKKKKELKF